MYAHNVVTIVHASWLFLYYDSRYQIDVTD